MVTRYSKQTAAIRSRVDAALFVTYALILLLAFEPRASIAGDSSNARAAALEHESIVTVEDLLHAEALGDAWFSPDGERVLFTRQRAAIEAVDRSYDDSQMTTQRLFVFERRSGTTREIIPPANAALSFVIANSPWEPTGRGVLVICVFENGYRLAYWSIASGTLTLLTGRPSTRSFPFAWIDGRVVYPVIAEGEPQRFAYRPLIETVARKWERAWTGEGAEVTVSSANPLFATTRPSEGALMLSDTTGRATKIAGGDYIAIEPSPNGRYLAAVRFAGTIAQPLSVAGQRGELQILSIRGDHTTLVHTYDDLDAQGAPNYMTGFAAIVWSPRSDRLLVGGKYTDEPRERARPFEVRLPEGALREVQGGDVRFVDADIFAAGTLLPVGWLGGMPIAIGSRPAQASPTREVPGSWSDYGEREGMRFDLFRVTQQGPQNLTAFSKSGTRKFVARGDPGGALVIMDGALWSVSPSGPRLLWAPSGGEVLDFSVDRRWPTLSPSTAYYRSDVERVALLVSQGETSVQRVVLDLKNLRADAVQDSEPIIASSPSLLSTVARSADGWRRSLSVHLDEREYVMATVNEQMQHTAIAPATKFHYRSGGKDLVGWYVTPPTTPRRPLPAVAVVYGGDIQGERPPMATAVPPVFSGQLLAAQGYVVIYPSLPLGSAGTSDPMSVLADETVAAVDALAAQGVVDAARVGVMGQSFGGWSTAAILAKRSDRFRAGVAMAGLYDYAWSYGTLGMVELLTDDGRFQGSTIASIEDAYVRPGPLWKNRDAYERISPIYYTDRIDAPLLMLAGDLDIPATSLAGAMRMYNALVRAGKQPALVRYWGEGHMAASPAAMRDQWYRVSTWFEHYLKH